MFCSAENDVASDHLGNIVSDSHFALIPMFTSFLAMKPVALSCATKELWRKAHDKHLVTHQSQNNHLVLAGRASLSHMSTQCCCNSCNKSAVEKRLQKLTCFSMHSRSKVRRRGLSLPVRKYNEWTRDVLLLLVSRVVHERDG